MAGAGNHRSHTEQSRATSSQGKWYRLGWVVAALGIVLATGVIGFFALSGFRQQRRPEQVHVAQQGNEPEPAGESRPASASLLPSTSLPSAGKPVETQAGSNAPERPRPRKFEELVEEAKQVVDRLVESFPDDPDALEVKARVYYYLGNYSVAAECWRRALELDPRYAYAYHGLGLIAAKKADYEEAVRQQRQAYAFAPAFPEAAVELAEALMTLGDLNEAITVLEEHVKVNPKSLLGHVSLGHTYLQAREFQKAHDAYRAALAINSQVPKAQFGLATALMRLGRVAESHQAMERYKKLRDKKVEIRSNLRSRFDDLEAMCADFATRFTYAARVYLAHANVAQAERLCRRAAILDPENTECRVLLASLYQQTGRGEKALEMCRRLTQIDPRNWSYHLNLGIMCSNLGRFDEAEKAFREVIRLAPQSGEGRVALARLYLRSGRKLAEATQLAQEAVALEPNAVSYSLLGQARAATGDRSGAVSAIEKAIELDPDNPRYRKLLGLLREDK